MIITNLGEGLVRLVPSTPGNRIVQTATGRKYSEVICHEEQVNGFYEEEVQS